jgi:hypothetical protein
MPPIAATGGVTTTALSASSSRRSSKQRRVEGGRASNTAMAGGLSAVPMELMRELSNFARETIQAKDQLIQLLMRLSSGPASN